MLWGAEVCRHTPSLKIHCIRKALTSFRVLHEKNLPINSKFEFKRVHLHIHIDPGTHTYPLIQAGTPLNSVTKYI